MSPSARERILAKLKGAPKFDIQPRPDLPPPFELSWTQEQMVARFSESLAALTGVVYRGKDPKAALEKLEEIIRAEGLKRLMASTDDVVRPLDLPAWGRKRGVEIMTPRDFESRESFKDAVFQVAEAGITGVDFAVAETGTLALVHDRDQARLVSLAPILHIALVPVERMVPTYEEAVKAAFGGKDGLPSQFTFITGPSQTGDIQGTPFKGMHGPRRIIVILIG
jgi:L-lactate dehydrogenase complex protein LldG